MRSSADRGKGWASVEKKEAGDEGWRRVEGGGKGGGGVEGRGGVGGSGAFHQAGPSASGVTMIV